MVKYHVPTVSSYSQNIYRSVTYETLKKNLSEARREYLVVQNENTSE